MDTEKEHRFDDARVILLRHAKSEMNAEERKLESKESADEEYKDLWSNIKLRDWSLSEEGVKECNDEINSLNNINIHTVFISPLRRTIQTAALLFKSHPNSNSIKFIIMPKAKESLESTDNIPTNIDLIVSEFSKDFPSLDITLFNKYENKYMYFFEDLDESLKAELLPQIKEDESDPIGNNVFELLIHKFLNVYPDNVESAINVHKRALETKKIIRDYIHENGLKLEEKVVLVSHKVFLKHYTIEYAGDITSTSNEEFEKDIKRLEDEGRYIAFGNCESKPDYYDYS